MNQPSNIEYFTREQQLARRHNTFSPYLCLENGLCRAFLEEGASAIEFEGVKLLFPFVREAVLLQVPGEQRHLADWMYFAFLAGHELGFYRPDLLPDVLPGPQLAECRRRLLLLQRLPGNERAGARAPRGPCPRGPGKMARNADGPGGRHPCGVRA